MFEPRAGQCDVASLSPHWEKERALVLIPARNEAASIGAIVAGCRAQGFDVWVLDDGSHDGTGHEALRHGARVLTYAAHGKTAILRWALQRIPKSAEWLFFLDGDGQHQPADLLRFWERRHEADLIIGNRWADIGQMPWLRRGANWLMTRVVNALSGGSAPDTQCGYRLVRRRLIQDWLPRGRHYEFETELYLHALHEKSRIESVPLPALYGSEKSKIFWPRDTWRFLRCLAFRNRPWAQDSN